MINEKDRLTLCDCLRKKRRGVPESAVRQWFQDVLEAIEDNGFEVKYVSKPRTKIVLKQKKNRMNIHANNSKKDFSD